MNQLKYGLLGLGLLVLLYFVFTPKKKTGAEQKSLGEPGNCITPPANLKTYQSSVNWGDFAKGVRDHLGDYEEYSPYALAYLKGINVEAKSTYVKYYQEEIRAYMQQAKALPHWDVLVGQYNCKNGSGSPSEINLA